MLTRILAAVSATLMLISSAFSLPTCSVTLNGKPFITSLPCTIGSSRGATTFEQGNFFNAEIRNGVLKSNVARFGGQKSKQFELDSYGRVTLKEVEGGLCYETPKLIICTSDSEE